MKHMEMGNKKDTLPIWGKVTQTPIMIYAPAYWCGVDVYLTITGPIPDGRVAWRSEVSQIFNHLFLFSFILFFFNLFLYEIEF